MEDNVKRNKRISEWQKDKRVVILVNDKTALKIRAEQRGHDSVNAYINGLIEDDKRSGGVTMEFETKPKAVYTSEDSPYPMQEVNIDISQIIKDFESGKEIITINGKQYKVKTSE